MRLVILSRLKPVAVFFLDYRHVWEFVSIRVPLGVLVQWIFGVGVVYGCYKVLPFGMPSLRSESLALSALVNTQVLDARGTNEQLATVLVVEGVGDLQAQLLPHVMPVAARLGSKFGQRKDPFTQRWRHHAGQDFPAPYGTPIRAAAAGVVIKATYHRDYGHMIEIDHGKHLVTRYGHASKLYVELGHIVQQGQTIALVGSSGRSTGPHLHFEVHWFGQAVNPLLFLESELAMLSRNKKAPYNPPKIRRN